MVKETAVPLRSEEPERDADPHGEDQGGNRQLEGRGKPLLDLLADRAVGCDRVAEVQPDPRSELLEVLLVDRLVEAVAVSVLGNERRSRTLAEERRNRAARQSPHPHEDEDR